MIWHVHKGQLFTDLSGTCRSATAPRIVGVVHLLEGVPGVHLGGDKTRSEIFTTMTSPGAGLTSARQSAPAASARPSTNARIDASKSPLVAVTRIGCGPRPDVPALLPQARHPTVGDPRASIPANAERPIRVLAAHGLTDDRWSRPSLGSMLSLPSKSGTVALAGARGACQIGPFPITPRRPPIRVRRHR
jgi:hypothetical protein